MKTTATRVRARIEAGLDALNIAYEGVYQVLFALREAHQANSRGPGEGLA